MAATRSVPQFFELMDHLTDHHRLLGRRLGDVRLEVDGEEVDQPLVVGLHRRIADASRHVVILPQRLADVDEPDQIEPLVVGRVSRVDIVEHRHVGRPALGDLGTQLTYLEVLLPGSAIFTVRGKPLVEPGQHVGQVGLNRSEVGIGQWAEVGLGRAAEVDELSQRRDLAGCCGRKCVTCCRKKSCGTQTGRRPSSRLGLHLPAPSAWWAPMTVRLDGRLPADDARRPLAARGADPGQSSPLPGKPEKPFDSR